METWIMLITVRGEVGGVNGGRNGKGLVKNNMYK